MIDIHNFCRNAHIIHNHIIESIHLSSDFSKIARSSIQLLRKINAKMMLSNKDENCKRLMVKKGTSIITDE